MRQSLQVKQCIGAVLQQISVATELSVWENMEVQGRMHHIPNPKGQQLIKQWLGYVELAERRDDLVKTLSGGMKGRWQIARALLPE
jgi:ABC-2 type transport system ATP-binding protein